MIQVSFGTFTSSSTIVRGVTGFFFHQKDVLFFNINFKLVANETTKPFVEDACSVMYNYATGRLQTSQAEGPL